MLPTTLNAGRRSSSMLRASNEKPCTLRLRKGALLEQVVYAYNHRDPKAQRRAVAYTEALRDKVHLVPETVVHPII